MTRCSMQFKSYGVALGHDHMFHAIQELWHSYGTMTRWSMDFKSYNQLWDMPRSIQFKCYGIARYNNKMFKAIQELWHCYGIMTRCSMQFKSYSIAMVHDNTPLLNTRVCENTEHLFRGRLESHNLYVTLVTLFQKMHDYSLTAGSSYDVTTSVRQLMFGYRMRLAQNLQFIESLKTYHDHCKMYIIVLNPWNSVFSFHVLL